MLIESFDGVLYDTTGSRFGLHYSHRCLIIQAAGDQYQNNLTPAMDKAEAYTRYRSLRNQLHLHASQYGKLPDVLLFTEWFGCSSEELMERLNKEQSVPGDASSFTDEDGTVWHGKSSDVDYLDKGTKLP